IGAIRGRRLVLSTIDPNRLDFRHGQAELLEVRLYIGGAIAPTKLDDSNTLPRAVQTGRKVVELLQFRRGERAASGMGLDSGRGLAPLEVRFRHGTVVDPKDALDDVGQFGWHRQRAGPAAIGAALV